MNRTFGGIWKDEEGLLITITHEMKFVTVEYDNGRGPFNGFAPGFGSPYIDVDFKDDPASREQCGLISDEGNTITWSNGTVWKRMLTNES